MNEIDYRRAKVYRRAIQENGAATQLVVAIEELSEVTKELCKQMRGLGDLDALAEEIADATIVLEEMRLLFNINNRVSACMDSKVKRLNDRLDIQKALMKVSAGLKRE